MPLPANATLEISQAYPCLPSEARQPIADRFDEDLRSTGPGSPASGSPKCGSGFCWRSSAWDWLSAPLYSPPSRESREIFGLHWSLASAALVLAVIVGLTTVPYLARRVAVARIRNVFDYDVTRAGIVYVVIVVVVGIAALNTGNNLLYIIVAAMLGAILCSGFASAMVLRNLATRCAGAGARIRRPSGGMARIRIAQSAALAASFSISVISSPRSSCEASNGAGRPPPFLFPPAVPRTSNGSACPTANCAWSQSRPPLRQFFKAPLIFLTFPRALNLPRT